MVFNSYQFIFLFLPLTLVVYWTLCAAGAIRFAMFLLLVASIAFYSEWAFRYIPLLLSSMMFNYLVARVIDRSKKKSSKFMWMTAGVALNVALLGYFKYANFLLENINVTLGTHIGLAHIILPIGISFYTFQQIAYLVDCYRGSPNLQSILRYFLFVSFFPHLIAGPITHHAEVMPQFGRDKLAALPSHLAVGMTIFVIGLFKKVVIADTIAIQANVIFSMATAGHGPTLLDAWAGTISYAFQIYFDFSGYTDMAIGLARMFGVQFPMNFASPYKASSMIDFWQRWHITLSRFLRDYVYFGLGGNRHGQVRRYINIFLTMLIGGIWHGAGWTYVVWGAMHGLFITLNHAWRERFPRKSVGLGLIAGRCLTVLCILITWVAFRASDLNAMMLVYKGMAGLNGFATSSLSINAKIFILYVAILTPIIFLFPNTAEWMRNARPILASKGYPLTYIENLPSNAVWRQNILTAIYVAILFGISILMMGNASEFIYFQF